MKQILIIFLLFFAETMFSAEEKKPNLFFSYDYETIVDEKMKALSTQKLNKNTFYYKKIVFVNIGKSKMLHEKIYMPSMFNVLEVYISEDNKPLEKISFEIKNGNIIINETFDTNITEVSVYIKFVIKE